jgi:hypothetical protein
MVRVIGREKDRRMKKATGKPARKPESSEMLPEYDLTGRKGTRGKYCQAYRQGHTVRICKEDGTVSVQQDLGAL